MKIEVENLDGHQKKITIEIPAEKVGSEFKDFYKSAQENADLKGFRKGKAPMEMIRKVYGESISSRVTQSLVEDHLQEALKTHSLRPISTPKIEAQLANESQAFQFVATFEAEPPIELKRIQGFKKNVSDVSATDAEIQKTLDNIRDQFGTMESLGNESAVAAGTFVTMDYSASEAGKEVPESSEKNATLEIGAQQLTPEFESKIIGAKVGQKLQFTISFPMPAKESEKTPMSGRTLDFDVVIHDVKKKVLPEADDALAQKLGSFKSLQELKDRISADITNQKKSDQKRKNQEDCISWLIEQNPVEAPESLVANQMQNLAVDAGMQLSQMGLDEKAIEEQLKNWANEMQERANRQVRASLLLSAIARQEKIQASNEDLRQEIVRIAIQSNKKPQEVLSDIQERGLMNGLVKQITELKALEWVLDQPEG